MGSCQEPMTPAEEFEFYSRAENQTPHGPPRRRVRDAGASDQAAYSAAPTRPRSAVG